MENVKGIGDIACTEIVPKMIRDMAAAIGVSDDMLTQPIGQSQWSSVATTMRAEREARIWFGGTYGKLGARMHESFTMLHGDQVDQSSPTTAEHVKRMIEDNEIMRRYCEADVRATDHARMLWEVKQKPVNRLPSITLMTLNVYAALAVWA